MKCINCSREIDEGSIFCGYCGKEQPKVKYCIKCGQEIGPDDVFCGFCGASQTGEMKEAVDEAVEKQITKEEQIISTIPTEPKEKVFKDEKQEKHEEDDGNESSESTPSSLNEGNSSNKTKKFVIIAFTSALFLLGGYLFFINNNSDVNLDLNFTVPQSPSGELVSGSPNSGLYYISTLLNADNRQTLDMVIDFKYYQAGNSVQAWDKNGGSILAEYTYTRDKDELLISSFRVYTKFMSKMGIEDNRLYADFKGQLHHEEGPCDGTSVIDKGTIKFYSAQDGKVYLSLVKEIETNSEYIVTDLKEYNMDGSIIAHKLVEEKQLFLERYIKTTIFNDNGEITDYTIEETIESEEDDGNLIEVIKTTHYDKNNNVISTEKRVENNYVGN